MLLLVLIGLFLIGVAIETCSAGHDDLGFCMAFAFGAITLIALLAMAITYASSDASYESNKQHHDFLVAQYEAGVYDSSVYSQYNLLQKIDEWNCDLAEMKKLTHNFWIGIFIPDYYDDLEYINVDLIKDAMRRDRQ